MASGAGKSAEISDDLEIGSDPGGLD